MKLTTGARVGPEPVTLETASAGAPHPPRPPEVHSVLWLNTRPRQSAEHGPALQLQAESHDRRCHRVRGRPRVANSSRWRKKYGASTARR